MSAREHTYTVELRVFGTTLNPDQITRETGLQPCQIRLAGSPRGDRTYSESMWAFNGREPNSADEWESLEEGLAFVLDRIAASEEMFRKYKKDYEVMWWCGHFQSRFDGGPQLSARLLERLGALGADLFIDNYFSARPAETE